MLLLLPLSILFWQNNAKKKGACSLTASALEITSSLEYAGMFQSSISL